MYLAHIDTENNRKQSVESHCLQTAELAAHLGKSIGLEQTCFLIGLYHDIGKATAAFQDYITDTDRKYSRGDIDHSTSGAQLLSEALLSEFNQNEKNFFAAFTAQLCALAIASHHGSLMDVLRLGGDFLYRERLNKSEAQTRKKEAYENLNGQFLAEAEDKSRMGKAIDEIMVIAVAIRQYTQGNKSEWMLAAGLLARLLYSCLLDADRQDTFEFMTHSKIPAPFMPWEEGLNKLRQFLRNKDISKPVNLLRKEISDQCEDAAFHNRTVFRLTLPCGSGKTLAGLRFALKHAMKHEKNRIIYVVPYITVIDQNVGAVAGILNQEGIILEHHSNISEDAVSYTSEILSQNWHSQIIFTTMVSFLDSLYGSGSKRARRMQAFINSVVIFDEVQTVPIKCISLFNGAINFLTSICKTSVVLCTATQPTLEYPDRPLRGLEGSRIISNEDKYFKGFKRNRAVDATINGGYDSDSLCGFALEQFKLYSTVLIIVNTKKVALELYSKLSGFVETVYHLSTSMCPAHRMEILSKITASLPSTPTICVSTPLIEAGVDISFNCVIRSITGLDSIAQASGRCNRECNPPVKGQDETGYCVFIVNPQNENLDELPEIKKGQDITRRILNEMKADHSLYGGDILSQGAIKQYFEYYYSALGHEMDYFCKPLGVSLYELLSLNNTCKNAWKPLSDVNINDSVLLQCFETANKQFSVIDSITTPVLVPYGTKGAELIDSIQRVHDLKEQYILLKKAQRYSINLFRYEFELYGKQRAIRLIKEKLNIYAITDEYYNKNTGITIHRDMKNEIV